MSTDAIPVSPISPKRKTAVVSEEDIIIKPSTELIPDEYELSSSESASVHIFRSHVYENLTNDLMQAFQQLNYNIVANANLHTIYNREQLERDLENIKLEIFDKSALILIFVGLCGNDDYVSLQYDAADVGDTQEKKIKEIWNIFSGDKCPELKNKPKIFFFCTTEGVKTQTDSQPHRTLGAEVYDFPAESDILIVYNKAEHSIQEDFLENFCLNMETLSTKYDIIDLVSHLQDENNKAVPLIISTLTRRFYLTPSKERHHYLSIIENNIIIDDILRNIKKDVAKLREIRGEETDDIEQESKKKKILPKVDGRLRTQSETDSSTRRPAAKKKPWLP